MPKPLPARKAENLSRANCVCSHCGEPLQCPVLPGHENSEQCPDCDGTGVLVVTEVSLSGDEVRQTFPPCPTCRPIPSSERPEKPSDEATCRDGSGDSFEEGWNRIRRLWKELTGIELDACITIPEKLEAPGDAGPEPRPGPSSDPESPPAE